MVTTGKFNHRGKENFRGGTKKIRWISEMKNLIHFLILLIFFTPLYAQKPQVISGKSAFKRVDAGKINVTKKVKEFPDLIIRNESFDDPNRNNRIDGLEHSAVRFTVENVGNGTAKYVTAMVSLKNGDIQGLEYRASTIVGQLTPAGSKEVVIPLEGKMDLVAGVAEFRIEVKENQGFDAFPLEMKIETHPFEPPGVIIADAVFSTETGGKLKLNTVLQMKFVVQNIGKGNATHVTVDCKLPENCLLTGESEKFSFDTLLPGENRELDLFFIATRRYTSKTIPIRVVVSENFHQYGQDTTFTVSLDQELLPQSEVVIAAIPGSEVDVQKASLTSSVDKNIPVNQEVNPRKFALVIGNEDYTKYQPSLQNEVNVPFARNDAMVFRDYLVKTLGYSSENVFLLRDATSGEMNQKIDLISKLAIKTGADAELLFYYAGHGLPDETTKDPYLIPVDVNGSNLAQAIKLPDIYQKFGEANASRITIILDACFSGGGRESGLLAARAVKIRPVEGALQGNIVVFSASKGDQSALPYRAEKHGLFTFFLLKKLQETSGNISYGALADYLIRTVSLESLKINQKEQDPVVRGGGEDGKWKEWKMRVGE